MIRRDHGVSAVDFYTDFNVVVMVMALFDCSSQHYDVTISIASQSARVTIPRHASNGSDSRDRQLYSVVVIIDFLLSKLDPCNSFGESFTNTSQDSQVHNCY